MWKWVAMGLWVGLVGCHPDPAACLTDPAACDAYADFLSEQADAPGRPLWLADQRDRFRQRAHALRWTAEGVHPSLVDACWRSVEACRKPELVDRPWGLLAASYFLDGHWWLFTTDEHTVRWMRDDGALHGSGDSLGRPCHVPVPVGGQVWTLVTEGEQCNVLVRWDRAQGEALERRSLGPGVHRLHRGSDEGAWVSSGHRHQWWPVRGEPGDVRTGSARVLDGRGEYLAFEGMLWGRQDVVVGAFVLLDDGPWRVDADREQLVGWPTQQVAPLLGEVDPYRVPRVLCDGRSLGQGKTILHVRRHCDMPVEFPSVPVSPGGRRLSGWVRRGTPVSGQRVFAVVDQPLAFGSESWSYPEVVASAVTSSDGSFSLIGPSDVDLVLWSWGPHGVGSSATVRADNRDAQLFLDLTMDSLEVSVFEPSGVPASDAHLLGWWKGRPFRLPVDGFGMGWPPTGPGFVEAPGFARTAGYALGEVDSASCRVVVEEFPLASPEPWPCQQPPRGHRHYRDAVREPDPFGRATYRLRLPDGRAPRRKETVAVPAPLGASVDGPSLRIHVRTEDGEPAALARVNDRIVGFDGWLDVPAQNGKATVRPLAGVAQLVEDGDIMVLPATQPTPEERTASPHR